MSLATYKFLPWLREGLANTITEKDTLSVSQPTGAKGRATLSLQVKINNFLEGQKDFMIVGPADVMGFSRDLVIRTQPAAWDTASSPNVLAHVEFYEEDFPWRYSPAKPDGAKLRPWISLIVLKESEFTRNDVVVPLPQIVIGDASVLPAYSDAWLWAHVQKIESSEIPSDKNASDHIISRLLCNRKLEANTRYCAFVIPTFETGRLAGLGRGEDEIKNVPAQNPAWGVSPQQTVFPVYYEWFFRTAANMDFDYLASLLEPRTPDPLFGRKPVDCSKPSFGIPDYNKEFTLYLEGALRSPQSAATVTISNDSTANLADFESRIKALLDIANQPGDPTVTPTFYGQKHIFEKKLLLAESSWIHLLNKNPAHRAVAGLGARVFRKYQDLYMQKAWEQLETIAEANKMIDAANASLAVCGALYAKNIAPLALEEMIGITAPVHVKLKTKDANGNIFTLLEGFRKSCFNGSVYSMAFRRLTTRRGPIRKKLEMHGIGLSLEALKKLMIEERKRPYSLDRSHRYKIFVTDRPKFTVVFRNTFEDRVVALSQPDFSTMVNAFAAMVANPTLPTCDENIMHELPGIIDPSRTIAVLLSKRLEMPQSDWFADPLNIKEALAYPDFEEPMYRKLKEQSVEWLAPNIHLIPDNTVTLLESNRKFIEAYMVGLNVSMNAEMRWREYPTDERGSSFRQFWDVNGIRNINANADPARVVEEFKDISPIHTWKNWTGDPLKQKLDQFGEHNIRSQLPEDEQLVFTVKGELLKCFPNTTIFAAKAREETYTENGQQLKKLVIDMQNPEKKFPAFKADAGIDMQFVGFDLTAAEAKGNATIPGWFFVLQETPGETRFANKTLTVAEEATARASSAQMASMLYQKPVMIAIHAKEMLT